MSSLADIGVKAEAFASDSNGHALLREIEDLLLQLIEQGREARIDLGSLPLSAEDFELLDASLGEGEVSATVESLGLTEIQETAIAGVWWVSHYNSDEALVAEFIEVTRCPELLRAPEEDLHDGLATLRAGLQAEMAKKEADYAG